MAKILKLLCDWDNKTQFEDGKDGTEDLSFSWDGKNYVIDLSDKNKAAVTAFMDELISKGRPAPLSGAALMRAKGEFFKRVRTWSRETEGVVSVPADQKKIPDEVLKAYIVNHPNDPQPTGEE